MSGELASKLRLVKCPKCRLLLPENPKYNVYKCGGCGTFLQAKKQRSVAVNSESITQETAAATRNAPVPPRENGLKAKANSSSSRECSLDGNVGRGQNKNGNCSGELLGPFNLSDEELETELDIYKLSHRRRRVSNKGSSNKSSHCEMEVINSASDENGNNEKSAQVGVKSEMEIIGSGLEGSEVLDNGNLSLERAQEELVYGSDDEDDCNDKLDLVDAIPEVEINGNGLEGAKELNDGNLLPEGAEKQLSSRSDGEDANTDKLALARANPDVETSGSDSEGTKELHNGNLSLKGTEEELVSGLDGDVINDKSALVGEILEVEISGRNIAGEVNSEKLLLEGAEEELNTLELGGDDPNNEQSVLVGEKSEVDITVSASATKRSSTQNFVSEKGSILNVTPGKLEEGTSGKPVSSSKQQKESQKNIHKSFERVRSVDTIDSPAPSRIPGGLYKSRTTRRYYGYDASGSSYDGKDERFPIQPLDSFENTYKVANNVSEGGSRKGKGHVNSMSYGDHGTRHQPYFPNERHYVMKDSRRNQKKVLESTTQHGHQHWMRAKRDEFPSRIPFHQSGFQSRYESGIPSNQMHDEIYSCEDNDQEKMKLLRMIHKLQDQLNRTRSASRETNGRLSTCVSYKGKHIPAYHSHDLHEWRFSHGVDHPIPTCNERYSHGVNWHQRHKFSRMPYPAEVTSSAHHADHSCFHCYPHKKHFSEDLLQHEELYRSYPGQDCCSNNSTPQRFKTSQFRVYGHETKSDDQRYMVPEVKKYLRRKPNLAKRYYKPVAGGAPFVTCHKCLKLLHLPADFLLFKRVCHQIKCGECSEILKFSLQNGSHIASYSPCAIGPPSSDSDDQKEVINNSSHLPSASHANYYHYTPADPISYTYDYGLHISKNYSS